MVTSASTLQKPGFNTPAILLRRMNLGDSDLILTFLSATRGKMAALAKHARKSTRRFAGVLELFSACHLVCTPSRNPDLPILKEASLLNPFASIRSSILKTAYASYWVEVADIWLDRNCPQHILYQLLYQVLELLDRNTVHPEILSLTYLMHFLNLAGLSPLLNTCTACSCPLDQTPAPRFMFNARRGGLICPTCARQAGEPEADLPSGVVKSLLWLARSEVDKAGRMRMAAGQMSAALLLLENFVTHHLGRMPRSLPVLRRFRNPSESHARHDHS